MLGLPFANDPTCGLRLNPKSSRRLDQAGNAQYPAFDLRHRPFGRRKIGLEERRKAAVAIGKRKPGGDTEGVVLVAGAVLPWRNRGSTAPDKNTLEGFFSVFKRGMKGVYQP